MGKVIISWASFHGSKYGCVDQKGYQLPPFLIANVNHQPTYHLNPHWQSSHMFRSYLLFIGSFLWRRVWGSVRTTPHKFVCIRICFASPWELWEPHLVGEWENVLANLPIKHCPQRLTDILWIYFSDFANIKLDTYMQTVHGGQREASDS